MLTPARAVAGGVDALDLDGWSSSTGIAVPGIPQPPEGQRGPNTHYAMVGPTFFETMEIPIVAGRALDKRDVDGAPTAAVVNQVFAENPYPYGIAVGKRHFL